MKKVLFSSKSCFLCFFFFKPTGKPGNGIPFIFYKLLNIIVSDRAAQTQYDDTTHSMSEKALMWSCSEEEEDIQSVLLKTDLNIADKVGKTALQRAARKGDVGRTKLLIQATDMNMANTNGDTALILAAKKEDTEIVRMLLQAGADVNIVNKKGKAALIKAIQQPNTEVVKMLLQAEADVNVADIHGYTALILS